MPMWGNLEESRVMDNEERKLWDELKRREEALPPEDTNRLILKALAEIYAVVCGVDRRLRS